MLAALSIPGFPPSSRTSATLPPALVLSLIVHAAAGGYVLSNWHRSPVEIPQPLTVVLEQAPAQVVIPPPPPLAPRKVERTHAPTPRSHHQAPVLSLPPMPTAVPVETVAPIPPPIVAAPEPTPAPTVIAKAAPSTADAAGRTDKIELPHFNVAYLNNPKPAYPSIARKLGLEGVVLLRVQVSATGSPEHVALAKTSGVQVLDEAAIKAVQSWTFVPAKRGDKPVAHPVEVPIRFQLNQR